VGVVFYPVCSNTQLDAFVYFDETHPTRRVYERVGRAMFALIPLCVRIVVINSRNGLATIEYGCSPNPVVCYKDGGALEGTPDDPRFKYIKYD
jgi:hypothetical protein